MKLFLRLQSPCEIIPLDSGSESYGSSKTEENGQHVQRVLMWSQSTFRAWKKIAVVNYGRIGWGEGQLDIICNRW